MECKHSYSTVRILPRGKGLEMVPGKKKAPLVPAVDTVYLEAQAMRDRHIPTAEGTAGSFLSNQMKHITCKSPELITSRHKHIPHTGIVKSLGGYLPGVQTSTWDTVWTFLCQDIAALGSNQLYLGIHGGQTKRVQSNILLSY